MHKKNEYFLWLILIKFFFLGGWGEAKKKVFFCLNNAKKTVIKEYFCHQEKMKIISKNEKKKWIFWATKVHSSSYFLFCFLSIVHRLQLLSAIFCHMLSISSQKINKYNTTNSVFSKLLEYYQKQKKKKKNKFFFFFFFYKETKHQKQ